MTNEEFENLSIMGKVNQLAKDLQDLAKLASADPMDLLGKEDTSLEHGENWWKCSTCQTNNWKELRLCQECRRSRYEGDELTIEEVERKYNMQRSK